MSGCALVCHPCGCRFGCLLEDHSGGYRIEALRPGRVLVGLRPSEIRPSSDANRCRTGCPSRGCIWNRASEGCRGSSSHLWIGGRCDQCARSLLGVLRHLLRTPRPRRRSPTRWPIFSSGWPTSNGGSRHDPRTDRRRRTSRRSATARPSLKSAMGRLAVGCQRMTKPAPSIAAVIAASSPPVIVTVLASRSNSRSVTPSRGVTWSVMMLTQLSQLMPGTE